MIRSLTKSTLSTDTLCFIAYFTLNLLSNEKTVTLSLGSGAMHEITIQSIGREEIITLQQIVNIIVVNKIFLILFPFYI